MFFPRLRRQAKWVFVLLIVAFAGGFVLYGVGTGQGGLEDLLQFNIGSDGGPSVSKLEKRIAANPKDAPAHLELSRALSAKGQTEEAISPLERYIELRPKDADALIELSSLYLRRAGRFGTELQALEFEAATLSNGSFALAPDSFLAKELNKDQLYSILAADVSRRRNEALGSYQGAASQAVTTYKKVTALRPDDADLKLALADTAEKAGDYITAIAAYTSFLKLVPDDSRAPFVRQRVKQLQDAIRQPQPPAPS